MASKKFKPDDVRKLLVQCHRRCCVCHKFAGLKMEIHHIDDPQDNSIDNALPVCFNCHAEVALYNPDHPKGRKYTPLELREHRDNWIEICEQGGTYLASIPPTESVGPLEGLFYELKFNLAFAKISNVYEVGPSIETEQFTRCLNEGIFSLIEADLREQIFDVYAKIKQHNGLVSTVHHQGIASNPGSKAAKRAKGDAPKLQAAIESCIALIEEKLSN